MLLREEPGPVRKTGGPRGTVVVEVRRENRAEGPIRSHRVPVPPIGHRTLSSIGTEWNRWNLENEE